MNKINWDDEIEIIKNGITESVLVNIDFTKEYGYHIKYNIFPYPLPWYRMQSIFVDENGISEKEYWINDNGDIVTGKRQIIRNKPKE